MWNTCIGLAMTLATASADAASFTFKIDPTANDAREVPLYVDDATLTSVIPSLQQGDVRMTTCINRNVTPAQGYIEFAPTPTGPHRANANRLLCTVADPGHLDCSEQSEDERKVVFDEDPSTYFRLGNATDLDTALAIARAFDRGEVDFPDGNRSMVERLPPREIAAQGDHFLVSFGDCGCSREVEVTRRQVANRWIVSAKITKQLCF